MSVDLISAVGMVAAMFCVVVRRGEERGINKSK